MLVAPVTCALIGAVLPFTPRAGFLGFATLPISFFLILLGMIATYLLLVELVKRRFYAIKPIPTDRGQPSSNAICATSSGAPPRFTHHATHNRPRHRPGLGPA